MNIIIFNPGYFSCKENPELFKKMSQVLCDNWGSGRGVASHSNLRERNTVVSLYYF
jgi:hypothetical protein